MRSRIFSFIALALLPLSLHAAVQNRIAAIRPSSAVPLHGNIHPQALRAQDLGAAAGDRILNTLTLRFSLTPAQQTALTQLLTEQQDPNSPQYHRWLTPEEYGARFGLSASDLGQVTAWLTAQGFQVTEVARSSSFVTFSGTVAAVKSAFHTTIHSLSLNGEEHIGNLTEPELPASLAGVTAAITGLSDFKLQSRAHVRTIAPEAAAHPQYTSGVSGDHFIAPGDFYTIYDVNPLLSTSVNGTGVTIAVMGQTDISLSDVAAFRSASGLSANAPTVKLYGTDPGTSKNDIDEAQLDVEWAGATAPSANILYVNSKDVLNTSLVQAVDNNLAPIISISYGNCETGFGSSNLNSFNQLFQQANAEGITIVGPGGDSGATDCDYHVTVASGGLAVDFPASSPFVTGVGGTMFNEGSGTYFDAANGANSGSALSYIPEAVWNETASPGATDLSAGGGGASSFFTKPAWQTGTGVPNDSSRDVPDISLGAAFIHDAFLFCSSGFCTNGFRNSQGYLDAIGGTSVSAPSFAGILALLEQKLGTRLGNANPTLYALANSAYYNTAFHDITTGNNDSPCKAGSPDCASGGSIGYNATAGYDLATGWGTVDSFNLVNQWSLAGTGGTGSTTGTAISATTLTLKTSSGGATCGTVSGTTYTLTVTVTGTSGTPTGSVQFLVDNVASGGAVALSGGTATFQLPTTGLSSGAHTVTAAYSGDTTYATSKGSDTVDLTSATAGDFSITPCTTTLSAAAGQAAPGILYTLTSLNGFTGPVNFSVSTGSATLAASYSFSAAPVTLSSNGTATTTLTIYAYKKSTNAAITPIGTAGNASNSGPWYAAGSGAMVAGLLLLIAPSRRRWTALFSVLLTCGVLAMMGCGSTQSTVISPTTATVTNASPGAYSLTVTASGTNSAGTSLVHNVAVDFNVQ